MYRVLGKGLHPPGVGEILGLFHPFPCIRLQAANTAAARGCGLVHRGQNGLTLRGGDKCRGDAAFRQNFLTTCIYWF